MLSDTNDVSAFGGGVAILEQQVDLQQAAMV